MIDIVTCSRILAVKRRLAGVGRNPTDGIANLAEGGRNLVEGCRNLGCRNREQRGKLM